MQFHVSGACTLAPEIIRKESAEKRVHMYTLDELDQHIQELGWICDLMNSMIDANPLDSTAMIEALAQSPEDYGVDSEFLILYGQRLGLVQARSKVYARQYELKQRRAQKVKAESEKKLAELDRARSELIHGGDYDA